MSLADALIVTGLGMGVVFVGLLLTAGLIVVFGLLGRTRSVPRRPAPQPAPAAAAAGPTDLPADVVAVITTVLEVERRLFRAEAGGVLRGEGSR